MSELRWILLLFGLIVVVAVYFLGRRGGDAKQDSVIFRHEPNFGDAGAAAEPFDGSAATDVSTPSDGLGEPATIAEAGAVPDDPWQEPMTQTQSDLEWGGGHAEQVAEPRLDEDRKVFSLRVAARDPLGFAGPDVHGVLQDEDLRHGKYGIFHRLYKNDEDECIFSVASLMEPGSFDLATIDSTRIPGLSFFMVLPGPQEASSAFAEMLATARRVADRMAGELQDHSGSTLSAQRASNLREEIINYEYHAGLRQRSQHH